MQQLTPPTTRGGVEATRISRPTQTEGRTAAPRTATLEALEEDFEAVVEARVT